MSLVAAQKSQSLEVFSPEMRGLLATFQTSAAMTKAAGDALEGDLAQYQTEMQAMVVSMYAENQKYQVALAEALERENALLVRTKTVEAMQNRINSLETELKDTRELMLREAQAVKGQMADMGKSHATALQTALAACSAKAKAENGALSASYQGQITTHQSLLAKAQDKIKRMECRLQNAMGKVHSWKLSFKATRQAYFIRGSRVWNGVEECDRLTSMLDGLETDLNPFVTE